MKQNITLQNLEETSLTYRATGANYKGLENQVFYTHKISEVLYRVGLYIKKVQYHNKNKPSITRHFKTFSVPT